MTTSRVGKVVGPRALVRTVDYWNLSSLRSSIKVRYHMAHTLQQMGFILLPINILPKYSIREPVNNTNQTCSKCNCRETIQSATNAPKHEVKLEDTSENPLVISSDDDDGDDDDCKVVEDPSAAILPPSTQENK